MNFFYLVITILIVSFISYQIVMIIKSKRSVGNPIPFDKIDEGLVKVIKDSIGLIYFYSPSCHNCKTLTPIIDNLKNEFSQIISVDISERLQIARAFNVMGSPSIVFFASNKIKGYYIGVKSETFIREKLNEELSFN